MSHSGLSKPTAQRSVVRALPEVSLPKAVILYKHSSYAQLDSGRRTTSRLFDICDIAREQQICRIFIRSISSMTSTLTFPCGHSAVLDCSKVSYLPESVVDFPKDPPTSASPEGAIEHQATSFRCKFARCRGGDTPVETLRTLAFTNISKAKEFFGDSIAQYIDLGNQYHALQFAIRAYFATDPICIPAHEQFAVADTPWEGDPFFSETVLSLKLISNAEQLLKKPSGEAEVLHVLSKLNNMHLLLRAVKDKMETLLKGVKRMEKFVSMRIKDNGTDELPSTDSMASAAALQRWRSRVSDLTNEDS